MQRVLLSLLLMVSPAGAIVECLSNNCYKETEACRQDTVCSMWLQQSTDWASFELLYKSNPSYPALANLYKCAEGPCATQNTYSSSDSTTKSCKDIRSCEECTSSGCTWQNPKCVSGCTLQTTEATQGGCKTSKDQCSLGYDPNKAFGAQTGYSCNTNEDCAAGQRCQNQLCYNVDQAGGITNYCSYDSDCPPGGVCQGSYCRANAVNNRQCSYPSDCPVGCTCPQYGGWCQCGGNMQCRYPSDCPYGCGCQGGWCSCGPVRYATELGSSSIASAALPPEAGEPALPPPADDPALPPQAGQPSTLVARAVPPAAEEVSTRAPQPSLPRMVSVHKKGPTTATLVWVPPARNFQCGADAYRVMYKEEGEDHTHLAFFAPGQTASHEPVIHVKGLRPNTRYVFKVAAFPHNDLSFDAGSPFAEIRFKTRPRKWRKKKKNKKNINRLKQKIARSMAEP